MADDFPENLYEVLGVTPDVSDPELRRAGRARQRATHPDLGGDAAEFTRVRLAVEVLTNPLRRSEHDAWLAATTGMTLPRRDVGARLRQQQRVSRSRPASPRPAPYSTVAGTDSAPAFSRIPKPKTDARRMNWYRRDWPKAPEVWPPRRPAVITPRLREVVTVLPFAVCTVAVCTSQLRFGIAMPWWSASYLLLMLAAVWLALRWVGVAGPTTKLLFWINIAGISLDAAGAFLLAILRIFAGSTEQVPPSALHGVLSLLGVGLAALAWWGTERRAGQMVRARMLSEIANETAPDGVTQRVWGEPGATALAHSLPGVNAVRRRYAEQLIGPELAALQRIPGVRIVHGVRLPDGDERVATISHAVLSGRRLALVDDRLWHPGRYGVDARGYAVRDGQLGSLPLEEFPHRVERFRETFPQPAEVRGWLAMVSDAAGEITVDNSRTWQHVRLATPQSLLREIGQWLAEDGELVDRLLLRDLVALRVEV